VLGLATRGMKTTQIAGGLCVSTQTVHSRSEAVIFALKQGYI